MADVATDGIATNASAAICFMQHLHPSLSITDMVDSLQEQGRRVNGNDFAPQEQVLNAQFNAMNAIFGEMCRRAALNMGEYPDAMERYLRLALKAQSQCRATMEALAAIKNPPVFARQANIAHGHQQVNYGSTSVGEPFSHAEESAIAPNKLSEAAHGQRLDTGAQAAAGRADQTMAAMGKVHRAKVCRG